jgi:Arc/MetJ-type ribon-helix-helix transcriptional regulator
MVRMKERITISVEPEALETARAEVKAGRAPSVSAAVEGMLIAQSRRQALKELLDEMDAEYGPLTEEEEEWGRRELDRAFGELSSSTPAP